MQKVDTKGTLDSNRPMKNFICVLKTGAGDGGENWDIMQLH